jgi:thiamine-phosphate pyrophosphorylase
MAAPRKLVRATPPHVVIQHVALIADGFAGGGERTSGADVQRRALDALQGALLHVHLRDHGVDAETFATEAEAFVRRLRAAHRVPAISVNAHLDVAEALGAGLHLGRRGPTVAEARRRLGPDALVSASVHSVDAARQAAASGVDAVFFSPVFATASKPGHPGTGLDALRACCEAVPEKHVFALGGVTPDRVPACLEAGAWGVAVLSGILYAADPAAASARYSAHLQLP